MRTVWLPGVICMMRRAAALRCGEQRQPALELAPRGRREGKARVGNRRAGTTRAATSHERRGLVDLRGARRGTSSSHPPLIFRGRLHPGTSGARLQRAATGAGRAAGPCLLGSHARRPASPQNLLACLRPSIHVQPLQKSRGGNYKTTSLWPANGACARGCCVPPWALIAVAPWLLQSPGARRVALPRPPRRRPSCLDPGQRRAPPRLRLL